MNLKLLLQIVIPSVEFRKSFGLPIPIPHHLTEFKLFFLYLGGLEGAFTEAK